MASRFDNPYLSRASSRFDVLRLRAFDHRGEIPADLDGTFYRIGPNPQFSPRGSYNPLMGDGMVHAFRVHTARFYRNRWVRTQQWISNTPPVGRCSVLRAFPRIPIRASPGC